MPAAPLAWFRQQFFDSNGDPLSSGTLEFYDSGTSTARAVFSDADLTVSAGLIVTLNSAGFPQVSGSEVTLYLSPVAYRVIVKNSAGTTLRTVDGVYALQAASSVNLDIADAVAGEALSAGDTVYLSDGSGSLTAGRWYRTDADNTYSSSTAGKIGIVPSAISSGATGTVRIGGKVTGLSGLTAGELYYVSATAAALTATPPTNARLVGQAESTTALVLCPDPGNVRMPDSDGTHHAVYVTSSNLTADRIVTRVLPDAAITVQTPESLSICEGRLTLTTAVPVTTADVTAATTIYFTPYKGNRIALYDGSAAWNLRTFSEISIAVPATTSQMYDVFVYDNAGTATLELTAWTNDTTRATALVLQNGVYVKAGATTRRYVGSFRTTGVPGQTEDSYTKRYLWNYYHRVPRAMRRLESTDTWTYAVFGFRQANAAAANQLDFVIGVDEVMVEATVQAVLASDTANDANVVAIGLDSTTVAATGSTMMYGGVAVAGQLEWRSARFVGYPGVGRHTLVWLEASAATATWYGDNGSTTLQSGITGWIEG